MLTGTLFALAAGLAWGLVFVAPLALPDYPAALLSFARYLAFGLIALSFAWYDRARLAQFSRADWLEAVLVAYRKGARKSTALSAMSASLSDADVRALAAHYSRQPARPVVYVLVPGSRP